MDGHDQRTLEARLSNLEAELARLRGAPGRRTRLPRRVRATAQAGAMAAMLLLLPLAVSASHQFDDVPDGHQFHGDITWLSNSGITAGCGGDSFCPDDAVTRGQMAAFLRRGLSAVASDNQAVTISLDGTEKVILSTTVRAGTQTGKTAYILVIAAGVARVTSNTGCPCRAEFQYDASNVRNVIVPPVLGAFATGETTLTFVDTIPTGVAVDITITASRTGGTGTIFGGGQLTVITAYTN